MSKPQITALTPRATADKGKNNKPGNVTTTKTLKIKLEKNTTRTVINGSPYKKAPKPAEESPSAGGITKTKLATKAATKIEQK